MATEPSTMTRQQVAHERSEILQQLEAWLDGPMLVLGFVWLVLLVVELLWGLSALLQAAVTVIWILFALHFALEFVLAPEKGVYLRRNWLTAVSLVLPALRVLRVARVVRLLRAGRAVRGLRLVRVVTSVNRGMKALAASMRRRGLAYVVALTGLVVPAGAAGMYAFEGPEGLASYGEALWWTAMLLTSLGSEYWPRTPEGRMLCLLLAVYGFAVFGYVTAAVASFFIGRDAADEEAELASAASIEALRHEVAALHAELRALREGGARDERR